MINIIGVNALWLGGLQISIYISKFMNIFVGEYYHIGILYHYFHLKFPLVKINFILLLLYLINRLIENINKNNDITWRPLSLSELTPKKIQSRGLQA